MLTDLLITGSLIHIDLLTVEYHSESFHEEDSRPSLIQDLEKSMERITFLSQTLGLKNVINVTIFEDETYHNVTFPLNECSKK